MSTLYPDLSLTNFPSSLDQFTTFLNIVATDGPLISQYQSAMEAGNTTLANQILAQIPQGTQKIITAVDINTLSQAILAVERFYLTDIEPYIDTQEESWLNVINQFSYQGNWASGVSYSTNNLVSFTTSGIEFIYIALSDVPVGTSPTNTNYWRVLTIQGSTGESGEGLSYRQEWNDTTSYQANDAVSYNNAIWMASQANQNQVPSDSSSYWNFVMSLNVATYPIQPTEPTTLSAGDLWFNTNNNPTKYFYLENLTNPAANNQIVYGYEAYDDEGNLLTGSLAIPTSLAVTTNPNKMNYYVGDVFDPTGMIVTATYSNGSQVIVSNYTYTPNTSLTLDDTTISISYVDAGYTVGTTLTITISNPIFGVSWDGGPSTKWTRIDASANFIDPAPAVNNGTGSSPFDNYMPWSGMVKSTDELGNVLVAIPKFWYKWTSLSNNGLKLEIANYAAEGFHVSPAHMDRGDGQGERDVVYVGRYSCAVNTFKSISGVSPHVSILRSNARSSIHNIGTDIWQWDFATLITIRMLYLVEFADWNCQATIGVGNPSTSGNVVNTGGTDAMQYHTGTTAISVNQPGYCQYRNIESLWDNVRNWVDGIRMSSSSGMVVIMNPSQFSDSSNGVSVGQQIQSDGYQTVITLSSVEGYDWVMIPTAVNGSSTSYIPDLCRVRNNYSVLMVGGNNDESDNSTYGLFYMLDLTPNVTYQKDGCRLMKLPNNN